MGSWVTEFADVSQDVASGSRKIKIVARKAIRRLEVLGLMSGILIAFSVALPMKVGLITCRYKPCLEGHGLPLTEGGRAIRMSG